MSDVRYQSMIGEWSRNLALWQRWQRAGELERAWDAYARAIRWQERAAHLARAAGEMS